MAPVDPNQIDISLSLLPGESKGVIDSLMKQLGGITNQLEAIKKDLAGVGSQDFGGVPSRDSPQHSDATTGILKAAQVAQAHQTVVSMKQSISNPEPAQSQIDPVLARERVQAKLQQATLRQAVKYSVTGQPPPGFTKGDVETLKNLQASQAGMGPIRRFADRAASVSAPDMSRSQRGGRGGRGGGSGGGEDDGPAGDAAWQRHFTEGDFSKQFEMPRIGEFTAQDSLNMISVRLAKNAASAQKRERDRQMAASPSGEVTDQAAINAAGFRQGSTGAFVGRAAAAAPFFSNLAGNVRPLGAMAQAFSPMSLQELGQRVRPGGGKTIAVPGLDGVRVRDPMDAARTEWEGFKIQTEFYKAGGKSPYLSAAKASEIGSGLLRAGFDKDTAKDAIGKYFAPVRSAILDQLPGDQMLEFWMKSMRAGGTSMSQFTTTLAGFESGARSARMSIGEFAQSADQYAEAIQASGGRYLKGAQEATHFSNITGLAPQVDTALRNNGLIQSQMFVKTGIMPQLQGLLPSGVSAKVSADALRQMAGNFHFKDKWQTLPGGGRMLISGRDQNVGMAASVLDIPAEAADKYLNQRGVGARSNLEDMVSGAYQADIQRAHSRFRNDKTGLARELRRIDEGKGQSHVGLKQIGDQLERAGIDRSALLDSKGNPIRGNQVDRAVNNALQQYNEHVAKKAGKGSGTSKDILHAQIDFKPGVADKLMQVIKISSSGDQAAINRANGGKVPPFGHHRTHGIEGAAKDYLHEARKIAHDALGLGE